MPTTLDEQVKEFMHTGVIYDHKGVKVPNAGTCPMCGRLTATKGLYTGKAQDVLCHDCLEKTKGAAYLFCGLCGQFIGLYKPGITPEEKYEVKPGDTLHLNWCPNCNPDAGKAYVVEFRDFMNQKLGNAPKPDQKQ